jgi:hypothetical protein
VAKAVEGTVAAPGIVVEEETGVPSTRIFLTARSSSAAGSTPTFQTNVASVMKSIRGTVPSGSATRWISSTKEGTSSCQIWVDIPLILRKNDGVGVQKRKSGLKLKGKVLTN